MKGKIVSVLTAILFGATMMVAPVGAATKEPTGTATEQAKAERQHIKQEKIIE